MKRAEERLAEVKKEYPAAVIGDADRVRVLYLFKQDPKTYHPKSLADAGTRAVAALQPPKAVSRRALFGLKG